MAGFKLSEALIGRMADGMGVRPGTAMLQGIQQGQQQVQQRRESQHKQSVLDMQEAKFAQETSQAKEMMDFRRGEAARGIEEFDQTMEMKEAEQTQNIVEWGQSTARNAQNHALAMKRFGMEQEAHGVKMDEANRQTILWNDKTGFLGGQAARVDNGELTLQQYKQIEYAVQASGTEEGLKVLQAFDDGKRMATATELKTFNLPKDSLVAIDKDNIPSIISLGKDEGIRPMTEEDLEFYKLPKGTSATIDQYNRPNILNMGENQLNARVMTPAEIADVGLPTGTIASTDDTSVLVPDILYMPDEPGDESDLRDRRIEDLQSNLIRNEGLDEQSALDRATGVIDKWIKMDISVDGQVSTESDVGAGKASFVPQGVPDSPIMEPINVDDTLYSMAGEAAGPLNAILRMTGNAPIVRDTVMTEEEMSIRAKTAFQLFGRDLVRALANNPRFPVGETELITKMTNIEPKLWQNEESLRIQLKALSNELTRIQKQYELSGRDLSLSAKDRMAANSSVNEVRNAIDKMGVPNLEEYSQRQITQKEVNGLGKADINLLLHYGGKTWVENQSQVTQEAIARKLNARLGELNE